MSEIGLEDDDSLHVHSASGVEELLVPLWAAGTYWRDDIDNERSEESSASSRPNSCNETIQASRSRYLDSYSEAHQKRTRYSRLRLCWLVFIFICILIPAASCSVLCYFLFYCLVVAPIWLFEWALWQLGLAEERSSLNIGGPDSYFELC